MKKLLVLFSALSLLTGCQDDDSVTTLPNDYESTLYVDGESFAPSPATSSESFVTTTATFGSPNISERTFTIRQLVPNSNVYRSLNLHITYTGTNASGTYTQYPGNVVENDFTGTGAYLYNDIIIPFSDGSTFTVTDLGNNKYKIEFNNITIGSEPDNLLVITGTFTGTFTAVNLEL
jgi:hypothetical protein